MIDAPPADVHQHLWPAPLVDELRRRQTAPRMTGWTLHLDGEPPFQVRPRDHDPAARAALEPDLGRIVVSLSSPLGIEQLPPDEAAPLLDTWHASARALGAPYAAWASVSAVEPDPQQLSALLAQGFVGLQISATQLATPGDVEKLAPTLAVAQAADKPVFVHPGPQPNTAEELPGWWPAVVGYVGQLQAAWWAWHVAGRALLPQLRICFAAGAGLAPVHHERFTMRGGGPYVLDPLVFVETSSYGRQGVDALARVLGMDALVNGSDRPYATPTDPGLGAAARHAIRVTNPHHLLEGVRS